MSEITLMHVIGAVYGLTEKGVQPPGPPPGKDNTALLLIDIQQMATPEYMARAAVKAGLPETAVQTALADYKERFYCAVENCSRVLNAARQNGIPPIHVKIESLSGDARDTSMVHKMLGWAYPPGSEGAQFLPDIAPKPGEIVLTKTVSGAFTGTILDRVLRHMGISYLFVCGFVTDECVETTVRDALDYGYLASIIRDATTAYTRETYAHVIGKFSGFGLTPAAEEVAGLFGQIA